MPNNTLADLLRIKLKTIDEELGDAVERMHRTFASDTDADGTFIRLPIERARRILREICDLDQDDHA